MPHENHRLLTTHVGSLPRPQAVVDLLFAQDRGESYDTVQFAETMRAAVSEAVAKQVAAGVDVVSDGEMSKISYATYIRHRLTGFEIGEIPRATPSDLDDYPTFKDRLSKLGATPSYHRPICTGPIAVRDHSSLYEDIRNLQAAVARHGAPSRAERSASTIQSIEASDALLQPGQRPGGAQAAFMNAASPGVIAVFQPNQHYPTHEAYLYALAEAMRTEYEAIVAAGLYLQIDSPDLAMGRHIKFRDVDDEAFLRNAELQVEALNYALQDVPGDRVRMHVCWGNYEGPHHYDIPFRKIASVVLKAKPGVLLIEGANPRHAHEWAVWEDVPLPEDKVLAPGVIDSVSNFIEHPDLVAERLIRVANLVGRERVMAGTDCGFGTFAGFGVVHPEIAYAKLRALTEGAAIASRKLWQ